MKGPKEQTSPGEVAANRNRDELASGKEGARGWWKPILLLVPVPGILLILAGGLAYTGGLAFFAAQRIRYNHFIWHLFVIAGTVCHYLAVLWYAA